MKQDERHHTSDDIFVGIDLATRQHQVVVLDAQGCRLTSFKVPHSRAGLRELVERCTSRRVRREGRVHFAFEATGHVWEAVGAFLAQRALRYYVVNPLATSGCERPGRWAVTNEIGWIDFYTERRPHSSLVDRTPNEAYTLGATPGPGRYPAPSQPEAA